MSEISDLFCKRLLEEELEDECEIISRWRDSTSNPRCEVNSEIESYISDQGKRGEPSKKEHAATWLRGNLQKLDDGPITLLVEGNYLERVEMVGGMEEGLGWGVNQDGLTNYSKGDNLPFLIYLPNRTTKRIFKDELKDNFNKLFDDYFDNS